MKVHHRKLWHKLATTLLFILTSKVASAQIVPDTTLPVNSIVTPQGNTSVITGGSQAGNNLFHSFQEFSILNGNTAFFNNHIEIQNIITRVTGNYISNIDGLIKANGNANLFLVNPNGIIFGKNAQLNIGGSFFASTANRINFADGNQFNAQPGQTTPLLTVSLPIGLQLGANPTAITAEGSSIQVSSGKNIALIGGNISLSNSNLTAAKGQIDLASIANGLWLIAKDLSPTTINNEQIATAFGDIQLKNTTTVDTSSSGGGNIQVQARRISLTEGSQIKANTLGEEPGGNLTINASESVELIGRLANGTPSALQARVEPGASGMGGNVTIVTGTLRLEGGARVAASSLTQEEAPGKGNAGNINVNASNAVELIGVANISQGEETIVQPSALFAQTQGAGNAGNINIETKRLLAQDGGQVSSETFGSGNAGNITVKATEIQLNSRSSDGSFPSGLLVRVRQGATGNGGNLSVNSQSLSVTDGARVTAASLGEGNGGNINIQATDLVEIIGTGKNADGTPNPTQISALTGGSGNAGSLIIQTNRLIAQNGGQISASTGSSGDGGILNVNANEVQLIGRSPDGSFPSGLLARVEAGGSGNAKEINLQTRSLLVQDGARIAAASLGQKGNGGNINIQASDSVTISGLGKNADGTPNPAQVSVLSAGDGKPGNLNIQVPYLRLNNQGTLTAASQRGNGGSIILRSQTTQLRNQSIISADAGVGGLEGNINITTDTIVLLEASKIFTNAVDAQGGSNITIAAPNQSGLAVFKSVDSTIKAAGELTVEGELELKSPNLPQVEVVDPTRLIAQACPAVNEGNSFFVTGRGGLPPNPEDAFTGNIFWEDLRIPRNRKGALAIGNNSSQFLILNSPSVIAIVEAQGWIISAKGEVILTANAPKFISHGVPLLSPNCRR